METLRTEIEKHIKKLIHPLKEDEELFLILKMKLTKKELKLLKLWAEGKESEEIALVLDLHEGRYDILSRNLIKKLNQERIKQVLCI